MSWLAVVGAALAADALLDLSFGRSLGLADARGEGRALLLLIAAMGAIHAIQTDGRSQSVYGLAVRPGWERDFLWAAAAGFAAGGAVYGLAYVTGAVEIVRSTSAVRILGACLTALIGPVIGVLQEITYRGYLNTVIADRIGWRAAIPAGAVVFAATGHFHFAEWGDSRSVLPGMFGLFLVGVLLGMARFYHGSLTVPIALVGGPLAISIVINRAGLGGEPAGAASAGWLFPPDGEVWQTPAMWILEGLAIAGYLILFARKRGRDKSEARRPAQASDGKLAGRALRTVFKINPFSNLWMLAPLDLWLRQLWRAGFRVRPAYWPRLIVSLLVSALTTVINLPERLLLPRLLSRRPVPDPIVIVGIHRSGTTYLHRLLALDPSLAAPQTRHVFNPTGFVVAGRILIYVIGPFLPWHRPMDSMEFSLYQPDEDEFALALSTPLSPYWGFVFPRNAEAHDRFIYPQRMTERERKAWQDSLVLFLRKLSLVARGRPVLKSPYHAARIGLIAERFPAAKFVHIYRHPYAVYRSNVHFQQRALPLFQMQRPATDDSHAERLIEKHYLAIEERFYADREHLGPDQTAEVKYEELEENPIATIEDLYRRLGLPFTEAFRQRLETWLRNNRGYRKNRFPQLPEAERKRLKEKLAPLIARWKYVAK